MDEPFSRIRSRKQDASTKLDERKTVKVPFSSSPDDIPSEKLQQKDFKHFYDQGKLDLSKKHLSPSDVSIFIRKFRREIDKLGLSGCGLTEIPVDVWNLYGLRELDLSNNPLGDSSISSLELRVFYSVRKLNLSGCGLKQIPNFHDLEVEELDLSNNPLDDSDMTSSRLSDVGSVGSVGKLNLSGCSLKHVPNLHCFEVEELDLSNNPLGNIGLLRYEMRNEESFRKLNISGCGLRHFPEDLSLHGLEELNLSNNPLGDHQSDESPWDLMFGISLRKLNLSSCGLKKWPYVLYSPVNLQELNLCDNFIDHRDLLEKLNSGKSGNKLLEPTPVGLGIFMATKIIFDDAVYLQTNGGKWSIVN